MEQRQTEKKNQVKEKEDKKQKSKNQYKASKQASQQSSSYWSGTNIEQENYVEEHTRKHNSEGRANNKG